jgi:hypothetical protein
VVLLVAAICLLSGLDLACTLAARDQATFRELNPLIGRRIDDAGSVVLFKVLTVAAASVTFLALRRHRITELACWTVGAAHVALAMIWGMYHHIVYI